jgi:hypothetical protein
MRVDDVHQEEGTENAERDHIRMRINRNEMEIEKRRNRVNAELEMTGNLERMPDIRENTRTRMDNN